MEQTPLNTIGLPYEETCLGNIYVIINYDQVQNKLMDMNEPEEKQQGY